MRTIKDEVIVEAVCKLCQVANRELPEDVISVLEEKYTEEPWQLAKDTLALLKENIDIAKENAVPICQDTGAVSVYVTLGQEVYIQGNFQKAIQEGVAKGYTEGYLRASMVADPLRRVNTENNTPASITVNVVEGNVFHILLVPKGFGSENMSQLSMLKPSDGVEGVVDFVVKTVREAGPNACPPMVVGVGIGGNFEKVTYLAKKAISRPLTERNPDPFYEELEQRLLTEVNQLGIGPQGFGGKTTVLGVAIETGATHVAGLPVAVNIGCHVMRRAECNL